MSKVCGVFGIKLHKNNFVNLNYVGNLLDKCDYTTNQIV